MSAFSEWYKDKVVLVTGGTSGIGRQMVIRLCQWGAEVIVCGRDASRLDSLKADLSSKEHKLAASFLLDLTDVQQLQSMIKDIKQSYELDVLINNAGSGHVGDFDKMTNESREYLEKLNMQAVTILISSFFDRFKEKEGRGILNVGSVASFFPTPGSALYCGTKHFILGLTDSLHLELAPDHVHVTGVYPGKTHSRFVERATGGAEGEWKKAMDAGVVAERALRSLSENKAREIPGINNKVIVFIAKLLPTRLLFKLMAKRNVQK